MFFLHADVSSGCAIGVRVRMNDRRNTMTITNITRRVMSYMNHICNSYFNKIDNDLLKSNRKTHFSSILMYWSDLSQVLSVYCEPQYPRTWHSFRRTVKGKFCTEFSSETLGICFWLLRVRSQIFLKCCTEDIAWLYLMKSDSDCFLLKGT
jgi:hypothetical protein